MLSKNIRESYNIDMLKFERKYAGKWVAIKNTSIVESDGSLKSLYKKVENRVDEKSLRFAIVPKTSSSIKI